GGWERRMRRQPFGRDPVVDSLAEGRSHVGVVDSLSTIKHVADSVACAELVEGAALNHLQIAARLGATRPPIRSAGERHVRRVAREVEAVDRTAHHLLFPVIVEIGQQRGSRSAYSRMDVAVDPRACHLAPRDAALPFYLVSWRPFTITWEECSGIRGSAIA